MRNDAEANILLCKVFAIFSLYRPYFTSLYTCGQTTGKPVYENYKHAAYDDNMKWYGASDAFVAAEVTTCNALLTNLSIY